MPLRVGVIGVGAMGENHVRNWAQIQEETGLVRLVGVYDQDQERAGSAAVKYGMQSFLSGAALLGEIEAVSIAVPTTLHRDFTLEALEAAYRDHPDRFGRKVPNPPLLPPMVWINRPKTNFPLDDREGGDC